MGDDGMLKLGLVGDTGGKAWDEKGHNKIAQIFISHGGDGINWIQFQYVEDGRLKLSERHGNTDGLKFDAVRLKQETEFITWIGGHRKSFGGRLCSITFGTNHGEYGPFGSFKASDDEFWFRLGGAEYPQFGGFHGTADEYTVDSIGVYLNPNLTLDHDDSQMLLIEASSLQH